MKNKRSNLKKTWWISTLSAIFKKHVNVCFTNFLDCVQQVSLNNFPSNHPPNYLSGMDESTTNSGLACLKFDKYYNMLQKSPI